MNALEIKDITVTYKNGHTALYRASVDIPQGSITALVGGTVAENPLYLNQLWALSLWQEVL